MLGEKRGNILKLQLNR